MRISSTVVGMAASAALLFASAAWAGDKSAPPAGDAAPKPCAVYGPDYEPVGDKS